MDVDGYNTLQALLYRAVHHYPGGAEALAAAEGWNGRTLSNKVNPGQTNEPTICDFIRILKRTNDYAPLFALNSILGYVATPLGDFSSCSDAELLHLYAAYTKEIGDVGAVMFESTADNRIELDEVDRMEKEQLEVVCAGRALLARMRSLAEAQAEADARRGAVAAPHQPAVMRQGI